MKRQTYYPSRIGDQVLWLDNYALKLPVYGPTLGVAPAEGEGKAETGKEGGESGKRIPDTGKGRGARVWR